MQNEKIEESEITLKVSIEVAVAADARPSAPVDALPSAPVDPLPSAPVDALPSGAAHVLPDALTGNTPDKALSSGRAVELHGLLHSMKRAHCNTQWKNMVGDERVRQCKACKVNAYRIDGLDGKAVTELINEHEQSPADRKPLYRRRDGAVMLRPGACGTKTALALAGGAVLAGAAQCSQNVQWLPWYMPDVLFICSLLTLLYVTHLTARRTLKNLRVTKASYAALLLSCVAIALNAVFEDTYSLWTVAAKLLGPLAWLYFFIALSMDGGEAALRSIRASRKRNSTAAEDTAQEASETPPTDPAVTRKRRLIQQTAQAVAIAFLAYCAFDFSWVMECLVAQSNPSAIRRVEFEKLLSRSTGDRSDVVRMMLAQLVNKPNAPQEAELYYRKVLSDLEPSGQNIQLIISAHKGLAQCYANEKKWDAAEREAKIILAMLPRVNPDQGGVRAVLWLYGPMYSRLKENAEPDTYALLGRIYEGKGDFANADKYFDLVLRKATQGDPQVSDVSSALEDYVAYLQRHGRNADANEVTEGVVKILNQIDRTKKSVAEAYARIKDPRTEQAFSQNVALQDQSELEQVESRIRFANYLAEVHRTEKAERLYQEAIKVAKANGYEFSGGTRKNPTKWFNSQLLFATGLYSDFLLQQNRAKEAAALLHDIDQHVTIDTLWNRDQYKYMVRYTNAMVAVADPSATKYATKLAQLVKTDPQASKPGWQDELR